MIVFIDMDGVLVDFVTGACEIHNKENPYLTRPDAIGDFWFHKFFNLSKEEFFVPMNHKFWSNLNWTHDGLLILRFLENFFGKDNLCLLSDPGLHPEGLSGKYDWISKNIPEYKTNFLLGSGKHFVSREKVLLIDDANHNVDAFRAQGGHAILVPRPGNRNHHITDAFKYLTETIKFHYS